MNGRTATLCLLALAITVPTSLAQTGEPEVRDERNYTSRVFIGRSMGRGFLGVQLTPLTPELRAHFGVAEDTGVMVGRVEAGGPAEAAGILVGDILTAIDGERVDGPRALASAVRSKKEGDLVHVELYRDGSVQSFPVTVSERDRRVVDLAEGYRFIPDMTELPDHDMIVRAPGLRLDEETMKALEQAVQELDHKFESAEWQDRIERLNELDFTTIQERMAEVERRLQELEKDLEQTVEKP